MKGFLLVLIAAVCGLLCSSPTAAEPVAVIRDQHLSWIILKNSINGPSTSRAFNTFQVSLPTDTKRLYISETVWFANCDANTLAFAGGSALDEDLKLNNILLPPGGPGHNQVISSDGNPTLRQVANVVCGAGSWIEAPDASALVKSEIERLKGG